MKSTQNPTKTSAVVYLPRPPSSYLVGVRVRVRVSVLGLGLGLGP